MYAADAVRLQDGDLPILRGEARQGRQPERSRPTRQKKGPVGGDGQGGRHIGDRTRCAEPTDRLAQSRGLHLQSPGPMGFGIDRSPAAPAVLVVRAVSYGKRLSTTLQRLRRGARTTRPRDVLLKASGDFTARLPIPMVDGGEESVRCRISNDAVAGAPFDPLDFDVDRIPHWEAWLESVGGCRKFTTSISGEGWDVVRYTGSRATARLTRESRRVEVVIERLNSRFQAVEQLFRGRRSVKDGELIMPTEPAWRAVHCQGTWNLTTDSDRPAIA
ncbi:hypothetical protein GCM10023329_03310 [Streptomyces sanyensis]|uniref:Uncharacterized protein n=1 Tax=Streptomyces sanyensis TaxID=568869 RepID=A0ABP8ZNP6_9ACTN